MKNLDTISKLVLQYSDDVKNNINTMLKSDRMTFVKTYFKTLNKEVDDNIIENICDDVNKDMNDVVNFSIREYYNLLSILIKRHSYKYGIEL